MAGYSTPHFLLARYTPDGQLDNAFGSGGQVQTDFETNLSAPIAGVAIQPDGKIILAGTNGTDRSALFSVERFRSDGSFDKSFGSGGKATAGIGNVSLALGLVLQADGKIVVVGSANAPSTITPGSFGVVRFNSDGTLDNGFGAGGKVLTLFGGFEYASGVVIQGDGKIVVGGSAAPSAQTVLALARYNTNGTLDNSFATGGMVTDSNANAGTTPSIALQPDGRIVVAGSLLLRFNTNGAVDGTFGMGGEVAPQFVATSVVIQSDNKIVTVGSPSTPGTGQTFAVARYNADGSNDTTFGAGGEVTTDFGSRGAANGVALQSDGKIVAAGTGSFSPAVTGFAVARYNADGSLDAGFGTAGKVLTTFFGKINVPANAVAIQPDGKIVATGGAFDLARYNADGSLDTGFGTAGRVTNVSVATSTYTANGLAIQADGKIVVVGATGRDPSQTPSFAVARYNADGSFDQTFGAGGMVTTRFKNDDMANAVAIQSDGKIVVVGEAGLISDFALARYNPDGSLDSSFGTSGEVTTDFSSRYDSATGVVLQPDGKIIVVGNSGSIVAEAHIASSAVALARYNTDGSLDAKFGTGGQLVSAILGGAGFFFHFGLAMQPDGRIVVGGFTLGVAEEFAVVRFLQNGSLDPSFDRVTVLFGGSDAGATSVAIQADGKIIATGMTQMPATVTPAAYATSFAIARWNADGSLDSTFGIQGKTTTDFGDLADTANAVVLQPDGKIVVVGDARVRKGFAVARYLTDNVGTANQRFVQELYWDLLRRPVDSSGLAFWSGQLDQGLSRTQVATAIQSSLEYHALIVGDLYKLVLGRTVDPSGLTTWVSFLNQGHTREQLEATLLGSDEFFITHGSDNNQGFLPALYQIVLQRPIDPSGAQVWGQALQSGSLSRQAVAAAILASVESDRLEVQSLYMQFLDRAPDSGGLDKYTNALQNSLSNEQVALILMGSTEYFSRV